LSDELRHNIRQHPVPARHKNLSPLQDLQQRLQERRLASTAKAFFELLDAQKLRLACVGLCFTRSEDFPVPLRRFEVSLFFGKGCPELFHRLKPFGFT